jgi:hypothetical protein
MLCVLAARHRYFHICDCFEEKSWRKERKKVSDSVRLDVKIRYRA